MVSSQLDGHGFVRPARPDHLVANPAAGTAPRSVPMSTRLVRLGELVVGRENPLG